MAVVSSAIGVDKLALTWVVVAFSFHDLTIYGVQKNTYNIT